MASVRLEEKCPIKLRWTRDLPEKLMVVVIYSIRV